MLWLNFRRDNCSKKLIRQLTLSLAWVGATLCVAPIAIGDSGVLSDRYGFVAVLGFVAAIVSVLAYLNTSDVINVVGRLFVVTLAVWCVMAAWVTSRQVQVWRDNETLYTHSVRMAPDSAMAYYRLGYLYESRGDWAKAIVLLKQSLVINPNLVRGHNNLGVALMNVGALQDAAVKFERTIELTGGLHYRAWNNLGLVKLEQNHREVACRHFAHAMKVNPEYPVATENFSKHCRDGL